ncbi:MAG TPA: hypothetical protein VFD50_11800 [Thermoleophilia bacterium]|nr:hypothetical protein [Thermoleophilia bacterium]
MGRKAPHTSHSTQHLTDVRTRRVYARAGDGCVTFGWDYPGSTLLQVRILRSERGFARDAEAGGDRGVEEGAGQVVVFDDVTGSFRDAGLRNGTDYSYTVFARQIGGVAENGRVGDAAAASAGEWVRWSERRLRPQAQGAGATAPLADRCRAAAARLRRAFGRRTMLGALLLIVCLVALAAAVSAALPGAAAAKATAPDPNAAYVTAAIADPQVAAVLQGVTYESSVKTWGGTQAAPAGATVRFTWPAAAKRDVAATWPLVKSQDNGVPVPPYTAVKHRLRIEDLTALSVDVLRDGRVIQIMPKDGESTFKLLEETWPPLSWFPWFTAKPWLLLPVFLVIGIVVIARAWRRSRAWNRRLPSMTRHDRQFIGRLAVILFLIAGLAWQVYEAFYAATAPAVDPNGVSAGQLAALPLLLFPPAVFLAALVLELSPLPHRFAWGLIALLAGAGGFYCLAIAVTSTANNLNLSYYVLLGILCLLAAPRAFSAGRMGWSRNSMPRYA